MRLEIINPTSVHPTTGYSHVARVGDLLFVSGQVSQDLDGNVVGEGDIRLQTANVFRNLQAVLEAAGSGLDLIAKTTVYTTSIDHRPAIAEIRNQVFEQLNHVPASTFAVVSSLAVPDWLVEIEAVAVVRDAGIA